MSSLRSILYRRHTLTIRPPQWERPWQVNITWTDENGGFPGSRVEGQTEEEAITNAKAWVDQKMATRP